MTIFLLKPSEPVAPGAGSVSVASLGVVPAVSRMVPPFNVSAAAEL